LLNFSKLSQHRVDVFKSLIYLIPHLKQHTQPNMPNSTSVTKYVYAIHKLCPVVTHPDPAQTYSPLQNNETQNRWTKCDEERNIPLHQWEQSCQTQKWAIQSWAASFYRSILETTQVHTADHNRFSGVGHWNGQKDMGFAWPKNASLASQ